ncbi:sugar phosphate isomerase/epimerase [Chitinophaga sedimenti]|uniref:sugar phosphate isomerase/epimerase family protein n=1 Tax=Chitinophaga sedimenti TaxID=2033606 RepID=UPI00200407A2|nr:twin-arginine translocation signal domain-containing protein [Chitinophaga sedimenti]MCK7555832.1 sugar phosphate isomerase/epimerase [Chitinophaga sedimenti]
MNQNRRNFIKSATSATAAALLTPYASIAEAEKPLFPANDKFRLLFMQTNWGFRGSQDEFCAAAKKEGYDGIEVWWTEDKKAQEELFAALRKHNLQVGFLCGGSQSNWQEHLATFKKNLDAAAGNTIQKPLYINCHSGKDYFTFEQNQQFIAYTTQKRRETGIPVYHETHRGRMLFAAHIARQFMEKNPELRLTLDISHWCNVHESLLGDQKETVDLALARVGHIHSRVGHEQGPQVNDPRAPEWDNAVKQHLAWWDKVVERKRKTGNN